MSEQAARHGGANHRVDAILLAGGRGARLGPYTAVLPKPLVPLGDVPVLEILLRRLRMHGMTNLAICTGHLAELIMAFFGNGARFGVKLNYTREDQPLGTAGPIRNVENLGDPFVVMNGDLLTTLDLTALLASHRNSDADATIAVYPREVQIDFGVMEVGTDDLLQHYREKPVYQFDVSMGVYVFKRRVLELIAPNERLDIPELVTRIQGSGGRVACYRSDCHWLDIGRPDDYARAQEQFERDRSVFLPDES
jgi:NDP-sugar pyrophosphorylase family protein